MHVIISLRQRMPDEVHCIISFSTLLCFLIILCIQKCDGFRLLTSSSIYSVTSALFNTRYSPEFIWFNNFSILTLSICHPTFKSIYHYNLCHYSCHFNLCASLKGPRMWRISLHSKSLAHANKQTHPHPLPPHLPPHTDAFRFAF